MDEVYQFDIGALRCTAVNDGGMTGNAAMLFANAPEAALTAALARHGETDGPD